MMADNRDTELRKSVPMLLMANREREREWRIVVRGDESGAIEFGSNEF